jgi:transcriptional regulator with XRE-family HTH domain
MAATRAKSQSETVDLRKACGRWLKSLRESAGLTQMQLARALGYEYYTFISQIEGGKGRIPSDQYEAWARAVGADPREFAITLLSYYEPEAYRLIWSDGSNGRGRASG